MRLLLFVLLLTACAASAAPFESLWPTVRSPARGCRPLRRHHPGAAHARPGLRQQARAWAHVARTCVLSTEELVAAGTAFLAAGFPQDCVRVLAPLGSPYDERHPVESPLGGEDVTRAFITLQPRCRRANARRLAVFAPAPALDPTRLTVDDGRLADVRWRCELTTTQTSVRGGIRYVRVTSGGLAQTCRPGGTEVCALDAIYRVSRDRLILVVDQSLEP